MPKKIPDESMRLLEESYTQGLPAIEMARKANVSYSTASRYALVRNEGFSSPTEYLEYLALENGFESFTEYKKHLAEKRQKRLINRGLSRLIKRRLKEIGENQTWLGNQIGVSNQAVSLYARGKCVPEGDLLRRLCSSLDISPSTLAEFES